MVCGDTWNNVHVERFNHPICYVDANIAGNTVHQNNTELVPWHWPGDTESIVLTFTTIVDTTILSIMNGAILGLPDHNWNICELWGFLEEHNEYCSLYSCNVTPNDVNCPATGRVKAGLELTNPPVCCVIYCRKTANSIAGAQTHMGGNHSYIWLDNRFTCPAEDLCKDSREESDDDDDTLHSNPRSFLRMKTQFKNVYR
jgi:hypothetical protein